MSEVGRTGAYLALFSEIGFVLFAATLAGAGLGIWADGQLGTSPILALIGFLVGMGIGGYGMYVLVAKFLARLDESERRPPGRG